MIAEWHAGQTLVVEPNIEQLPKKLIGHADLVTTADALRQADVIVMLVDHKQFKAVPAAQVTQSYIVDTKGVWQ